MSRTKQYATALNAVQRRLAECLNNPDFSADKKDDLIVLSIRAEDGDEDALNALCDKFGVNTPTPRVNVLASVWRWLKTRDYRGLWYKIEYPVIVGAMIVAIAAVFTAIFFLLIRPIVKAADERDAAQVQAFQTQFAEFGIPISEGDADDVADHFLSVSTSSTPVGFTGNGIAGEPDSVCNAELVGEARFGFITMAVTCDDGRKATIPVSW